MSAENTPTSKRDERDTRHTETNETTDPTQQGVAPPQNCCIQSSRASVSWKADSRDAARSPTCSKVPTRAVSSAISVSWASHLEVHGGPGNQSCSASRVSSAVSVSSPQSTASSHFASSASLARDVLLMFISSLPSCTYFRHSDGSLLMISRHSVGGSMRRASFQIARAGVFALDMFSKCTRDLLGI